MSRARPLLSATACCAVLAAVLIAALDGPGATAGERLAPSPGLHLRLDPGALPTSPRVGDVVHISGHVRYGGRSVAVLQGRPGTARPGAWQVLARRALKRGGGHFALRWRVPASLSFKPWSMRLAVLVRGRAAAFTIPVQGIVGPATHRCAAPVPPAVNIPVGSGWVVGGAYIVGGPYPGVDQCFGQAYTVTAVNAAGAVVATQTVAGGRSYTLVLPAGTYTLSAGSCATHAAVTVAPARQTQADVVCDVP